ncbi:cytochrome P450 [Meridianimarinicoccus roseus]|uniref:Cytochrome P450 n=1 Tax=Meridianimarinicoccus roseus TaxID=2072018 RepID=A0A2V2LDT0_9RHOB|nr:cytochrome P450 [Meridianimarinicoccus roseus]PWR01456.1 cytochrome P450 [Meridianimarinicoccus roseus]
MHSVTQSPADPQFVQNPYAFYDRARVLGPVVHWAEYGMPALLGHAEVTAALRDRRLGRVPPGGLAPFPPHLAAFGRAESLSLLSLEGSDHARLRALVLRAFTARRVAALAPEIEALCHALIDGFPDAGAFDLMAQYATRVPVIVIARLLGVPETACEKLLDWSHAMVAMYRPGVGRDTEEAADRAARDFTAWLNGLMDRPGAEREESLLGTLLGAEAEGALSRDESLACAILLLNAGHEATVHALGNAARLLMEQGDAAVLTHPARVAATVEECLRLVPPLHVFTRHVLHPVTIAGHDFAPGREVACLLGAANRDPAVFRAPDSFGPGRTGPTLTSFGGGVHFCLGAPLARLELQIALRVLFERCHDLRLAEVPALADIYHFHGHDRLMVARDLPATARTLD